MFFGMCFLLFCALCQFSFQIWPSTSLTEFFKGRLLDPVVKRRLLHAALVNNYEVKLRASYWYSFVRGEYIQLIRYSLIACINFSEVAVYCRYTLCFHKWYSFFNIKIILFIYQKEIKRRKKWFNCLLSHAKSLIC